MQKTRTFILTLLLLVIGYWLLDIRTVGASPPASFQSTQIIGSGLNGPSGLGLAPDGRIFILERTGKVKIYKNGALLAQPFVDLPASDSGDRGLIGIVFDPDFATNKYVYFYYTNVVDLKNYLVRFSAAGDIATDGPVQIFQTNDQSFQLHVGGGIAFGPDGKIYIPIGDNGYAQNAQNLNSLHGKILRLNRDGTVPIDNPFYNTVGAQKAIWAWGLRNPYRIHFDSVSGRLYAGDVGQSNWEEVNLITRGGNYGWPNCEGLCQPENSSFIDPEYTYPHNGGSNAVTMGPIYRGDMFPPSYNGRAFVADYAAGFIRTLSLDSQGHFVSSSTFDSSAGAVVDLKEATDGSIYYVTYYPGRVYRLSYSTTNPSPIANSGANVTKGIGPLSVQFTSSGSLDPNGDSLTFLWDFGDGTTSTAPNPTKTYTLNGTYVVELTVSDGVNTAQAVPIVIQVGQPPVLTIGQPANNSTYIAGDTIIFTAAALDGAGFDINDNGLSTEVLFHHDTHIHPFLGPVIGRNGSFVIPDYGESSANTWYEIRVTATDSSGLSTTKSVNIYPQTTTLTFTTNPPGLPIAIDGQPQLAPYQVPSVIGYKWNAVVSQTQNLGTDIYEFTGWSDGNSSTSRFITAPSQPTVFTANYVKTGTLSGFSGQYYANQNLAGSPVLTRLDPVVNFDWGEDSPGPGVPANQFSVRWTSTVNFTGGSYLFTVRADDGVRLKIDGVTVLDKWLDQGPTTYSVDRSLTSGDHVVVIEYYENSVGAVAQFGWTILSQPTPTNTPTPSPTALPTPTPQPSSDFIGSYFANISLAGSPAFTRTDSLINFDWGESAPAANFPDNNFSVRWIANPVFPAGLHRFTVRADDGVRLIIDGTTVINKWQDQGPTTYTYDINLSAGTHSVVMEYYEHFVGATAQLSWEPLTGPTPTPTLMSTPTPTPTAPTDSFLGQYYPNLSLSGSPALTRIDPAVNFNWGEGSPASGFPANDFSVRWTTTRSFASGLYRFTVRADDGVRLLIDGTTVINKWQDQGPTTYTHDIALTSGDHTIVMEYYEHWVGAVAELSWTSIGGPTPTPILPTPTPVIPTPTPTQPPVTPLSFNAEFFFNKTLSGSPLFTRTDPAINFNWGYDWPDYRMGTNENYSARWTGILSVPTAATYRFTMTTDDGSRLKIDGITVLDKWYDHGAIPFTVDVPLTAGNHQLVLEYYQGIVTAYASLSWIVQ